MGKIIMPDDFWAKPPPVVVQNMAQERVILKMRETMGFWSMVLSSLCKHGSDVSRGRKIQPIQGGFSFPWNWQEDLPPTCHIQVIEEPEAGRISIRLLELVPEPVTKTEGFVPDEQKRMEDSEMAG